MREWTLTYADPMAPRIAADARSGRTEYTDDQTWQLRLGPPEETAIALETRYGGRVGLARIVPAWTVGRRQVLETQGYHAPPVLTAFAPDYLRVRAGLTLALDVLYEFWAMESQAVGGRITLRNTSDQPQSVTLNLAVQAARENRTLQVFFLTLDDGSVALQLGRLPSLQPVLLLEGAAQGGTTQSRLSRAVTDLAPGASLTVRWVLAGLPDRNDSLSLAHRWLSAPDWDSYFAEIAARAEAAPQIETGDRDHDLALAWNQQLVQRSFLAASGQLPHPSFVDARKTVTGYSASGVHGSGFNYAWGGQTVPDALAITGTVALSAPELAQGVVRNFIAVQRDDGWIDARPGLDGQRVHLLAPPLLATLTETVYRYTGDRAFAADVLDGLVAFFMRWATPPGGDVDRDGDGVPEWSDARQGAFAQGPTLAQDRPWSQGVDITTIEAPDLLAYLVRDAQALVRLAEMLDRGDVVAAITPHRDRLSAALGALWDAGAQSFQYRDRDSHATTSGAAVFEGKGDQPLSAHTTLPEPGRLILRVSGGLSRKPAMDCTIEGVDIHGNPANETVPNERFSWYRGGGSATTRTAWRAITYLKFGGLSRVFKVEVRTVNLARPDISLLAPLLVGGLDADIVAAMVAALTDAAQYGQPHGLSGVPASDPAYDPTHHDGPGGTWPEWNARLGIALLERGYAQESAALFARVLAAQTAILKREGAFRRFWNPATGEGMGDAEVIQGAVSLDWFARLFGAFAIDAGGVAITGSFALGNQPVTWTQHGVRITRSADGTQIAFPSGHTVELPPDASAQVVRDPKAGRAARARAGDVGLLPDGT